MKTRRGGGDTAEKLRERERESIFFREEKKPQKERKKEKERKRESKRNRERERE